jgi:hypothetical protein
VTFSVYAAHIAWDIDGNLQARQIAREVVAADPLAHLVMAGDFNDEHYSTQNDYLDETLIDAATQMGWYPGQHISWPSTGFDETEGAQTIDLVFSRRSLPAIATAVEVMNLSPVLSDHKPVVADLLYPRGDQPFAVDPLAAGRDTFRFFPAQADLPANLLVNPGAEDGQSGWVFGGGAKVMESRLHLSPRTGDWLFTGYDAPTDPEAPWSWGTQTVDLSGQAEPIDAGRGRLYASAWMASGSEIVEQDGEVSNLLMTYSDGEVIVETMDVTGALSSRTVSGRRDTLKWHPFAAVVDVPPGTRQARVTFLAHHKSQGGNQNGAAFDDLYLGFQAQEAVNRVAGPNLVPEGGCEPGDPAGLEVGPGWAAIRDYLPIGPWGVTMYPPTCAAGRGCYVANPRVDPEAEPVTGPSTLAREVDLTPFAADVDAGNLALRSVAWIRTMNALTTVRLALVVLDSDGTPWATFQSAPLHAAEWTKVELRTRMPPNARRVRLEVRAPLDREDDTIFADELALVPELIAPGDALQDPPFVAPDLRLRASYATRDLPVPLGISTAGYWQTPGPEAPRSPFGDLFQATTTLLHPPRVQVVHILKGDRRLILVAGDLIAIFRSMQTRIIDLVRQQTGVDVSGALVMMANHTHSGPGRLFDSPMGPLFSDTYRQESFDPVAWAMADAIVQAMSRVPAVPVRVGTASLGNDRMHNYRRCPQIKVQDDTMIVTRLDRVDGGKTLAIMMNYAMHGTVFAYGDGMLGGDAPRSVELKVQEALPGAPPVMFMQSWAGDMAPGDPRDDFIDSQWPTASMPALDRLEALGRSAAETVLAGWDAMQWQDDPELVVVSAVAPMGVEAIGYAAGEWDHPAGAMLCGGEGSICSTTPPNMEACQDLDYGWIPDTVRLGAFRLGILAGVTLPGEPHTPLAKTLVERVKTAVSGVEDVMLLGYSNDYVGYLMLPDDYAAGGYEPGMAFFGPRQGEYLRDAAASLAARLAVPDSPLSFAPATMPDWAPGASTPYAASTSIDAGSVVMDFPAQAVAGDELVFQWKGGDPWLDHPEVAVQAAVGLARPMVFTALRAGGRLVDQRDYRVLLAVMAEPAWGVAAPDGRTFTWTATVRTGVRIPAPSQGLAGTLRLAVTGHALSTSGLGTAEYAVTSQPVLVSMPR